MIKEHGAFVSCKTYLSARILAEESLKDSDRTLFFSFLPAPVLRGSHL